MRTDLICAVLDCDESSLSLLDNAKANIVETIFKMEEMGWSTKMTDIVTKICIDGVTAMEKNIKGIKKILEGAELYDSLTDYDKKKLASLRKYNLRPLDDFQCMIDRQNGTAYLSCSDHTKDVYEEFFREELESLMNYTGLVIKTSNDKEATEAVEICPYCSSENVYPHWDVETQGYIAKCQHCGKEIFLCDECHHSEDNPKGKCDWHEENGCGRCFRGITKKERAK